MMKVGAIDVGTNSCRMLAVEQYGDKLEEICFDLKTTRLGQGVDEKRLLNYDAVRRTLYAIEFFVNKMEGLGVERIRIVGTSALRDVRNSNILLDVVKRRTGYELEVISGVEEARLTYTGASFDINGNDFLIIDIGGGSTEFIWQQPSGLSFKSLDMGAVRMTERYIKTPDKPVDSQDLARIKEVINRMLKGKLKLNPAGINVIGVGGTITTLAAIDLKMKKYDRDKVHGYKITRDKIEEILLRLAGKTLEERRKIVGLQPERADIIVAGTIIALAIIDYLALDHITVSEHDILYGLIKEMLDLSH
ncbi:Ppx/GppA phosphatase family protein [Halothermothrix orenii]|uniref:Exopolyphosphatase n=1 Tax=Halothermothrix orenii (strain H 168 / OCM 544 / DSM 9562) TaxID=373903 RepID=B8D061_HALOH|nr:Ppx/GppA phosphatase family protein [Halothermothrix orenii]ACL68815.1 Exopolyphosphatase [Halothermothrix orenii H 168]